MAPIVTLLVTVTISLLTTRVGAIALQLTGLTPEVARFQARSAFTGVGFTTGESETLVNHPVRRQILMMLMFWGNIGIAAVIATTIASFANKDAGFEQVLLKIGVLLLGIAILWAVFTSRWVDDWISRWVEYALVTWTNVDVCDYTSLLHLHNGYVVVEIQVRSDDWIQGKSLAEANLSSEGVLVLGLTRLSEVYVGSPNGQTEIQSGDTLTVYGPSDRLDELDIRKQGEQGDRAHRIAVQVQKDSEKKGESLQQVEKIQN